jgi:hypothetical protein
MALFSLFNVKKNFPIVQILLYFLLQFFKPVVQVASPTLPDCAKVALLGMGRQVSSKQADPGGEHSK